MFRRVVIMLALMLSALLGVGAYALSQSMSSLPPLFVGLNCNPTPNCGEAFNSRLRQRFPMATTETDLTRELRLEGFQLDPALRAPQRRLIFDRRGNAVSDNCRRTAEVNWSADEAGHLTAISGSYAKECL